MYILNQKDKIPLHIQLYKQIKNDLITNKKIGDKLDSIRKIANTYNLSKNTVETAYSQLVIEGYIESFPRKGYVVIETNANAFNNTVKLSKKEKKEEDLLYDFYPAKLEKSTFPLKTWKRLFNKAVNESLDFGSYHDGQGEFLLRSEIKKYLASSRAVNCNEEQIIICNGFADSISLLGKLINDEHKYLAMEDPGYPIVKSVFDSFNYKIEKIPLQKDGIDLNILKKSKSKIVYVTPSHQYPTGITMPISKRMKLLKWAKDKKGLIIEDDYDSELSYLNRPIPSLQGLDDSNHVIYVGTFSKALSPAIRVSYMVLPLFLIEKYKKTFEVRSARVCLSTQKTLELFFKEGYFERHLRKIRTINRKKHNLMKMYLEENIGETMKIEHFGGGLFFNVIPIIPFDYSKLEQLAKEERIGIYLGKKRIGNSWDKSIMIGFGRFKEEEIKNAVNIFSKIWKKSIL